MNIRPTIRSFLARCGLDVRTGPYVPPYVRAFIFNSRTYSPYVRLSIGITRTYGPYVPAVQLFPDAKQSLFGKFYALHDVTYNIVEKWHGRREKLRCWQLPTALYLLLQKAIFHSDNNAECYFCDTLTDTRTA